jgi:phospholipase/carboxylesterase
VTADLLPAVVLEPEGDVTASVIFLHGLGADGHDFEPVIPLLGLPALGARVVLPHAPSMPVSINGGFVMPAWYDIRPGDLSQRNDEEGIRGSAELIEAWLRAERSRGIPSERIVLAGFSQGGAMALHVGLRWQERLAGLVALSTYLVLDEDLESKGAAVGRDLPVFQAHGTLDPVVPLARGRACHDRLVELGHPVEWHDYPMEHAVHPQELADLGAWFAKTLA